MRNAAFRLIEAHRSSERLRATLRLARLIRLWFGRWRAERRRRVREPLVKATSARDLAAIEAALAAAEAQRTEAD